MTAFVFMMILFFGACAGMATPGLVDTWGLSFMLFYWFAFASLVGMVRFFPDGWSNRRIFWVILVIGLVLRGIFAWFPASFDVNRYVWEGYIQTEGFNPYIFAPNDPALSPIASGPLRDIWERINHKELTACYPPLSMFLFRALATVRPDPQFFKLVMAMLDAAVLLPLAVILKKDSLPLTRLLWYAANPLLLVFIAGEGHLDSLMVLLLCLGVAFSLRGKDHWGFLCIGGAGMAKYLAWLALPFLLRADNWKKSWIAFLPGFLFLAFSDAGLRVFRSAASFGTSMHYNDSLAAILRPILGSGTILAAIAILIMGLLIVFLTVQDRLRSLFLAFGCLLICLPTLHPWYLSLVAPFAAAFASPAWIFLHASTAFTFPVMATDYATGVFQEIHWLKLFEYVPFFGLLVFSIFRRCVKSGRQFQEVKSLSVIVPTLNEADYIGTCLETLSSQPAVSQVIVADGGSDDATRDICERFGATVVSCPRGRGLQIREGIRVARGDVIMILHADCRLRDGVTRQIVDTLNAAPYLVGGAVGMAFEPRGGRKGVITFLNNLRTRLTDIAFGDQGQFFRTEALPIIGGFPAQMFMEDVELSFRLKEVGPLAFLPRGVVVSGRRWDKGPFMANVIIVLHVCIRYLIERRLGLSGGDADDYYNRYYGPSS